MSQCLILRIKVKTQWDLIAQLYSVVWQLALARSLQMMTPCLSQIGRKHIRLRLMVFKSGPLLSSLSYAVLALLNLVVLLA